MTRHSTPRNVTYGRLICQALVPLVLLGSVSLQACGGANEPPKPPAPAPASTAVTAEESKKDAVLEPVSIQQALQASDREPGDQDLDPQRHPVKLFEFFKVRPGMRVAELGAGRGYTTELLARVVGSEGAVYGQNSRFILERFAEQPWSERLKKPALANVTRIDAEFDAPLPGIGEPLDLVLNVLFYHDTVWMEVDRPRMNQAVFDALAPGGVYGIVDHSAADGAGTSVAKTLHRIEEKVLIEEVMAVGFMLEGRADFLRNPEDSRDWNAAPSAAGERRGTSDRFVLKFRKPRK